MPATGTAARSTTRTRAPGRRRTNLALLVCLAIAFATGVLAYATGAGWGWIVVAVHGVAGLAIVVLVPWKAPIVRSGMRAQARGRSRAASVLLGVLVLVVVVTGILHATGLWTTIGMLSPLNIHVAAALAIVPLALWHVFTRPVRPRATDLDRRSLIKLAGVAGGATLAYAAMDGIPRVARTPGADRRFTGSHEIASFVPSRMPTTIWLDDSVPAIDPREYALTITTPALRTTLGYDELLGFDDTLVATLDCTGGWYSTQEWRGVRIARLVPTDAGRTLVVVSQTGFSRRYPLGDAESLLLATHVGGTPLGAGHGFPLRLVAPGRRGFWWVKWVGEIKVDDRPWWLDPPFPLT